MIQLIKNVVLYREGAWRPSELLLAGGRIEAVGQRISCAYDGLEVVDGRGMLAIPGYLDQHVHITGGGGEGGFLTQVPPMRLSDPVKAGVTTLVGLLGTDSATRSVANLVARTKALRAYGLTAYCLTGSYHYPSPTLTGSVTDDIVFVEEIIGAKLAISDHRCSHVSREELIRLASDVRLAGLLSGKPGIVHLHTGSGKGRLDLLFDLVEHTDIPIQTLRPTHLANKYDDALRFARLGGYIDFTCDGRDLPGCAALLLRAMEEAPAGLVTVSTDSNGSLPRWNEKKELVGIEAASIQTLHETVKTMVQVLGCPLERAIAPATEHVARALNLYPAKGCLAAGSDGDILLLDEALNIRTVYAMGRCMLRDGVLLAPAPFEN